MSYVALKEKTLSGLPRDYTNISTFLIASDVSREGRDIEKEKEGIEEQSGGQATAFYKLVWMENL